ncbi:DUF4157 domain-containing protein [Echinicola jeungdonensis]|uniref:DUF4157 domain-containing protein n=1 Tax=Echinicola jeungdonensis TaxID=709343 RepID=A0ABV5J6U6_9BACT|nr:DUF4157 domain-containing protein [Echinicola jeungdonensis]MDN3670812.1 DUF4157 domain-containing protein [Echinicola jeungdonensis]
MREFKKKSKANSQFDSILQQSHESKKDFFGVQAKLEMGQPGDKYEKEADAVADQVVHQSQNGEGIQQKGKKEEGIQKKSISESISRVQKKDMEEEQVQSKCAECEKEETVQKARERDEPEEIQTKKEKEKEPVQKQEEEEEPVQTKYQSKTDNQKPPGLESRLNQSKGAGNSMDVDTKQEMESGFGADFSHVNIHTDDRAIQMSKEVGAQAFTHGNDIYFNQGKYDPTNQAGKYLLAHELTHTIQQKGRVQRKVQKTLDDGHDLTAARFAGNIKLEAAFDNEHYIKNGSRGESVRKIQAALMEIGYDLPEFGADGIFGSETKSAVTAFQNEFSLAVDGIVGPETMGTLDNIFGSVKDEEVIAFNDDKEAEVLDGDSDEGPTIPTQEKSINQLLSLEGNNFNPEVQTAPLKNPPDKVPPPAISIITINLTKQNLKILWSNGVTRGPYDISSGRGCPNTKGNPCVDPKRGDKDTYCTPVGNFEAEKIGGKDYKSSAGDAMSWYMSFVPERGIGTHNAQKVTGTPRSHGCVRVVDSVAKLIHNNVTTSSKIKITGKANTPSWKLSKAKAKKSYKGCPGKKAKK